MALLRVVLLVAVVGAIFVNGWTDAPTAIATAVSTGAIGYRRAVSMAAACNLLGLLLVSLVSTSVVDTISAAARFAGGTPLHAAAALCAAMLAIVLFAVGAWRFGIPTSESHALIAGLSGAAFALGGAGGVDAGAWRKVALGLLLSVAAGLVLGALLTVLLRAPLGRLPARTLRRLQVAAAGGMAFVHGAQDGQKFAAVLVTANLLSRGQAAGGMVDIRQHWAALLLCACAMALGTGMGGKRIIETVGGRMVALEKAQGVCADLAGALCLLLGSLCGIPMSTTHTKTTAMMGAGLTGGAGRVDGRVIGQIAAAWLVTFPVCAALGFLLTRLFLRLL